jgi:hypothetical protein
MKLPSKVHIITWFVVCALCVATIALIGSASFAARPVRGNSSNAQRQKRAPKKTAKKVSHCNDPTPSNQAANKCTLGVDKPFVIGCSLPFSGGESRPIDEHCPNEGCTQNPPDVLQNKIKNNLCASGTPVEISFVSIDKLQADVDKMVAAHKISYGRRATPKNHGKKGPPSGPPQPDKRPLIGSGKLATVDKNGHAVKLGEGDLVTIDAFVLDAKHDDTFPFGFGGETVNCKNSLLEWNDIHVALGRTATMAECNSVTAEILPHFRPAVWERFDSNSCTVGHVTNPLPVKGIRVRITGQLFFDGSHLPNSCARPNPGGNPLRRSVWEIHPVYKIEVFNVATSGFITLEQWAAQH